MAFTNSGWVSHGDAASGCKYINGANATAAAAKCRSVRSICHMTVVGVVPCLYLPAPVDRLKLTMVVASIGLPHMLSVELNGHMVTLTSGNEVKALTRLAFEAMLNCCIDSHSLVFYVEKTGDEPPHRCWLPAGRFRLQQAPRHQVRDAQPGQQQ